VVIEAGKWPGIAPNTPAPRSEHPGVVGGLVSLGLIGIFVGPVVRAVTYTLLNESVARVTE
jgi:hypothetical protein